MDELTTTTGIVAVAAAATAVLALLAFLIVAVRLRRLRRDQAAVLGGAGTEDLVSHAAGLRREFGVLRDYVEEMAERLDARVTSAEARLDRAVAHHALVRYDAYGELSGHQSTSIALLDAAGSGLVLSSIAHRDQARLYVKQVRDGRGEPVELSPEESEAVSAALAASPGAP